MSDINLEAYWKDSRALLRKYPGKGIMQDALNRVLRVIEYARELERNVEGLRSWEKAHCATLAEAKQRIAELEAALEPFTDPYQEHDTSVHEYAAHVLRKAEGQ